MFLFLLSSPISKLRKRVPFFGFITIVVVAVGFDDEFIGIDMKRLCRDCRAVSAGGMQENDMRFFL